ncbi:lipid asymmetry maintenance protein MlaB [Chromobacterium subtsugae]|uniref:STAS domain-containing protein n=1 Tax=Chromobacterium subtsugae TaxID=251747 RepID=UPI001364B001|nr:STAS domain-containing protein [Chromobacterium subtsugae]
MDFDEETGRHLFRGELGVYTAHAVQAVWLNLLQAADGICMDLAGVTEIDTAGLQLLLQMKLHAAKSVSFCNASEPVREMARLVNQEALLKQPDAVGEGWLDRAAGRHYTR